MATKKKAPRRPSDATNAVSPADAIRAKPALTQAVDTAKALDSLIESRPATAVMADAGNTTMAGRVETTATEAPPESVAAILEGPLERLVLNVFQINRDKEYKVNAVIEELKAFNPEINENSVRFTITELKRKSLIHRVRNEGYYQILKFTNPGEGTAFPNAALFVKPGTKAAGKSSPADIGSDLAILKEASAVIVKLGILVQRNQGIFTQIAKLRSVL